MASYLKKLRRGVEKKDVVDGANNGVVANEGVQHGGDYDSYDHSPLPWLTWNGFFMGVLVSMGGFIFGYDTGQISGFLGMSDFLERYGNFNHKTGEYYFSNVRVGLIVGLLSIGTLTGALIAGPVADRIGRRWSIFGWCLVFHVGNIVQISAPVHHWYHVMMGRFVLGLSVGALSLMVPMYMAETAPFHIRGAMIRYAMLLRAGAKTLILLSTYQLFITLGIFIAACINYGTNKDYTDTTQWRVPMGIGFLWPLVLGVGILFFPDTPRYDFRHGRIEKAKQTMMRVYGVSEQHWSIHKELEEIKAKLEAETVQVSFMRDTIQMFSAPRMAFRLALGVGLQMFQQLTGANYFFYYGTLIFKGVTISPFVTQLILNGINFGCTFIGLWLIENVGRRKSMMIGSAWMFVCFLIFASVGHFSLDRDEPTNTPKSSIALIVFACFFILGFATTWGPMVWTIIGELYPSRYRAKGMALATASNWFWNFLLAFFTNFITGAIDFRYGYVFAGCNILGGLIVFFFVLEGRNRTLEELDTMYIEHVVPWKSTEWVMPALDDFRKSSISAYHRDVETRPEGVTSGETERSEEKEGDVTPAPALHLHTGDAPANKDMF
ncbi:hexose transporter hxt5 [Elasticomyces elasticus]|nr:hexose transporter hxt5 [Elasticomyces elasticus]